MVVNKFKLLKKLAGKATSQKMIKDKTLLVFCRVIKIWSKMNRALIRLCKFILLRFSI